MTTKNLLSLSSQLLFFAIIITAVGITLLSRNTRIFGWQLLIVQSGSMAPTIPTGSLVFTAKQSSYDIGDIVAYRHPSSNSLITHRIVEKSSPESQTYILRGDANPTADQAPIALDNVQGKAMTYLPFVGFLFAFLQTPLGVISVIVIPGAILIYEELRSMRKNLRILFQKKSALLVLLLVSSIALSSSSTFASYTARGLVSPLSFETTRWSLPGANISQDGSALKIRVINASGINKIVSVVRYTHKLGPESVIEQVTRTNSKDPSSGDHLLPSLLLGTCSGEDCVPHEGVSDMSVSISFYQGNTLVHTSTSPFSFH